MRHIGETHKISQATIREQLIDDVADDVSSYRTQVNLLRRLIRRARALRGSEEAPPLVRRKLSQIDG